MQQLYTQQFAVALDARARLLAHAPEPDAQIVNDVMDWTVKLLDAYMSSEEDPRTRVRRWLSPRPPLDRPRAEDVVRQQGRAIELLESTLARSGK